MVILATLYAIAVLFTFGLLVAARKGEEKDE